MTDDATPTSISEVGTAFVPASDQHRPLEFFGQHRWIEMALPGAENTIALMPPSEGAAPGDVTRCALATADIETAHAPLRARGVDVDPEIARAGTPRSGLVSPAVSVDDPVPPQFFRRDPNGTPS